MFAWIADFFKSSPLYEEREPFPRTGQIGNADLYYKLASRSKYVSLSAESFDSEWQGEAVDVFDDEVDDLIMFLYEMKEVLNGRR